MKKIRKHKLLSFLLLITILSIITSIIFSAILSIENKKIISNNINELIKSYSNNKYIIKDISINSITNLIIIAIIWLIGISIIGSLISGLIYIFKTFILSFEIISLITTLKINNYIFIILYILPKLINNILLFIITYYSISYSIYLLRYIFYKEKYNLKAITKKYLKILIVVIIINLLVIPIELFILPKIYKLIY